MGIYESFTGSDIFPDAEGLVERTGWIRTNGPYKIDCVLGVNLCMLFFILLYKYIIENRSIKLVMN